MDDLYNIFAKIPKIFADTKLKTIYHYTSLEGFSGIVSNHEIWMSNTAFMNDTSELVSLYNNSIFNDSDFTNKYVRKAWKRLRARSDFKPNIYMASFSRVRDSLDQWRLYGCYCIGFDSSKMISNRSVSLHKCFYRPQDIRRWLFSKEKDIICKKKGKRIEDLFAEFLISIAATKYKTSDFKNEQEVRLITNSHHNWEFPELPELYYLDPPIHFRKNGLYDFPIPYVKFYIEEEKSDFPYQDKPEIWIKKKRLDIESGSPKKLLPIEEVIIGPIAYQKEAKLACEIMLAEKVYKDVKVRTSNIPFRGL